jgi:hypothetical protein
MISGHLMKWHESTEGTAFCPVKKVTTRSPFFNLGEAACHYSLCQTISYKASWTQYHHLSVWKQRDRTVVGPKGPNHARNALPVIGATLAKAFDSLFEWDIAEPAVSPIWVMVSLARLGKAQADHIGSLMRHIHVGPWQYIPHSSWFYKDFSMEITHGPVVPCRQGHKSCGAACSALRNGQLPSGASPKPKGYDLNRNVLYASD